MGQYYYVDSDSELWSDFERGLEEGICYDSLADIIYETLLISLQMNSGMLIGIMRKYT